MATAQAVSITVANGHYKKPDHLDFSWAPPLYEKRIHEGRHVRIVCIGAGFSGLCAAVHFRDHLEDFELQIYERADDVGGVWHQNRYPGVACDVPSHSYQFSFCEKTDWSAYYAPGQEIQGYLATVANRYQLRQYIKHKVERAEWNESTGKWTVTVVDAMGRTFEDECDFVLFATGLLSTPIWPADIPGRDTYRGKVVHSGDWKAAQLEEEPGFDWGDKRVGVIGVGASGVQIVPSLQKKAKQVINFGRSKLWLSGGYGSKMLEKLQAKKKSDTNYYFTTEDIAGFQSDEAYRIFRMQIEEDLGSTHELSFRGHPLQQIFAEKFEESMRAKAAMKPKVVEALLPDFPVGCKRITPGPGYLEALSQDNCDLVTDKLACFTPNGLKTVSGEEYELDIVVCATGFDVSFRPAFPIIGKDGINLQDAWCKESRTYLGMFAPELPNAFNVLTTQSAAGSGSLLVVLEQQCRYITQVISKCQRDGYKKFVPKQSAVDDFLRYTDNYFARTVLTTNCKSWYKNGESGEAAIRAIWPGSGSHCYAALLHPRWEDFEWERLEEMDHSMSWLGNGCASHINGAQVHLGMRQFYKPQSLWIY